MMKAGKAVRTFFEELASKPRVGGLRITDTAVQFMMLERAEGQIAASFALPLPPGIVVGGKLADPKEFERILAELRALIAAGERRGSIRVVASLPPSVTYAQSFTIPNVGPERLPMTADLNVQMISPIAVEEAYMSWHILKETADTYELLGVFAERKVVDAYRSSLEAAGFSPVVFEPQSLSLSWTITDAAGAKEAPLLVLNVTSDGVNMFLLRGGGVFFDYFRSWRSIQDTDTRITTELFYQTLVEEVRKVVNFVFGRFHKTLAYVFLNAPGTEAELKRLIEEKFSMRVVSFAPRFARLTPAWFTVLGAALRGNWDRSRDVFASLGTERVRTAFYHEQIIEFIHLWRNVGTVALGMFTLIFLGALVLLRTNPNNLGDRLLTFNTEPQERDLVQLEERADEFNNLVAAVRAARAEETPFLEIVNALEELGKRYRVVLDEMTVGGASVGAQAVMQAPSYDTVLIFKRVVGADPRFKSVDIPLGTISPTADGAIRFTLRFVFTPQTAP